MTRLSITLLAVILIASPFLAEALSFHPDFKFYNGDSSDHWSATQLKNYVDDFFTKFDEGKIKDLVKQMHPQAKIIQFGESYKLKEFANTLTRHMWENTYETQINQMVLSDVTTEKNAHIMIMGCLINTTAKKWSYFKVEMNIIKEKSLMDHLTGNYKLKVQEIVRAAVPNQDAQG